MKSCRGRVFYLMYWFGLVSVFWVRSWSKCFIHFSFDIFYCPLYYLCHSSCHTHLLYVFFSHLQCPAVLPRCFSDDDSPIAVMCISSHPLYGILWCTTRHVAMSLFFLHPKNIASFISVQLQASLSICRHSATLKHCPTSSDLCITKKE